ncbi:helix-turn-helix domain-containing protein [Mesobacillus selenatarsenatis]|nr:helix-turn-helix domain-containing protein [Mesobacillus selenatarsenatis]
MPERSICYNLEPYNIESANVESLTNFIKRLSEEHVIPPGAFLREFIPRYSNEESYEERNKTNTIYSNFTKGYAINSIGKKAENLSEILNILTGRDDLQNLTLLPLKTLIEISDIRTNLYWCPKCWESENGRYEKLVWNLKVVRVCTKHGCYLESICPSCKRKIKHLDTRTTRAGCNYCGKEIPNDLVPQQVEELELEYQKYIYLCLDFLIYEVFATQKGLEGENLYGNIKYLIENCMVGLSIKELAIKSNVNRHTIFSWLNGSKRISLETLLKLAFSLGVQFSEIYSLNLTDIKLIKILELKTTPISKLESKIDTSLKVDITEREVYLDKVINENSNPPQSLEEVTRSLGYKSIESLREHFPEKCSLISKRYKEYKRNLRENNEKAIENQIKNEVYKCFKTGVNPTIQHIEDIIGINGVFMAKRFRAFRRQTIEEIHKIKDQEL